MPLSSRCRPAWPGAELTGTSSWCEETLVRADSSHTTQLGASKYLSNLKVKDIPILQIMDKAFFKSAHS